MTDTWSTWLAMPAPANFKYDLVGPAGSGVMQVRNRRSGEWIYLGRSGGVLGRLRSLMPKPHGTGNRDNAQLRDYVLANYADLEYRTLVTRSPEEAKALKTELAPQEVYRFAP